MMHKICRSVLSTLISCTVVLANLPVSMADNLKIYSAKTIEPTVYANHSRAFYEGNGGFSDSKIIYLNDFMEMNIWEDSFDAVSSWKGASTVNTLGFNGLEYKVMLTDPTRNDIASTFAATASDTAAYVTLDIPDGNFAGISILGGSDKASVARKGVIRFNYSDNTSSGWIEYDNPSVMKESENSLEVTAKKISSSGITGDGGKFYLHQINIFADEKDEEKVMTSIDIASRNAYLDNGELTVRSSTKYAEAYYYNARFVALSMLIDKAKGEENKVAELRNIINTLPGTDEFDFSEENIEKLYEIQDIYNRVLKEYITKEDDLQTLGQAEEYIKLIDEVKIIENNERIDNLASTLGELPPLDKLTLSESNDLIFRELEEMYKVIDTGIAIDESRKEILDKYDEYKAAYRALLVEENNELISQLKEIAESLPDLAEFSKRETYSDEVVEKLYKMEDILNKVDIALEISDKGTYELAKEYVSKLNFLYETDNEEIIRSVESLMEKLPSINNMEYTVENEKIISEISQSIKKLYTENLTSAQKSIYDTAVEYTKLLKNFPPLSVTMNPQSFANMNTAYRSQGSGLANSNSENYFIDGAEFMKMDIWKEGWNVVSNYADNTLVFNGIAYKLRVANGDYAVNAAYCALADTKVGYDVIELEPGLYSGISFLGGTNTNGRSAAVAFNYTDGTGSEFITQSISNIYTPSSAALEVPAGTYSASNGSVWGKKAYLYQYTFKNPQPDKEVASVSIPFRNAIITNGELTCGPTSGGTAYTYWGRWLAMTLLQSRTEFEKNLSEKFYALEKMDEEQLADKISETDAAVKNAEIVGIDPTGVDGYDIYAEKGKTYPRIKGYECKSNLEKVTLEIGFACDVDIAKDDAELVDVNGQKIDFEFSYANNAARLIFRNDMDYQNEYTLKLSGAISAVSGGKVFGKGIEYKFYIPKPIGFENISVEKNGSVADVSFVFKNYSLDSSDVLIIVCVFDNDEKMVDSFAVNKRNLKKGETINVNNYSVKFDNSYSIKVFCWDGLNGMNTIYKY